MGWGAGRGGCISMVEAILFDLDETLYAPGALLIQAVDRAITAFVAQRLSLDWKRADALRVRLWTEHGATVRGLQMLCDCEPRDLHAFCAKRVDPADYLAPDPTLRTCLAALAPAKYVFTNAAQRYSRQALTALGVADLFRGVFAVEFMGYRPKPDPLPYRWVLDALAVAPEHVLMVDDNPPNLRPAAQLGMRTLLVGSRPDPDGHPRVPSVLEVSHAL